jgi:hypothetical protein
MYWENWTYLRTQIHQPEGHLVDATFSTHTHPVRSAVFDDPNLVSSAGLVPMLALARSAGLTKLADQHLSVPTKSLGKRRGRSVRGPASPLAAAAQPRPDGSCEFAITSAAERVTPVGGAFALVIPGRARERLSARLFLLPWTRDPHARNTLDLTILKNARRRSTIRRRPGPVLVFSRSAVSSTVINFSLICLRRAAGLVPDLG